MQFVFGVGSLILGYLFGSINAAVVISGKFLGGDVRQKGSHNAGATNMARVYGLKAGFAVFLMDFAKTIIPMVIGNALLGSLGAALAGAGCEIGHCWPLYFKFKGGKGVTTAWAVGTIIDWRIGLIALAVWVILHLIYGRASVNSLAAVLCFPIFAFVFGHPSHIIILGFVTAVLVWVRHAENIKRLLRGEEKRLTLGGK